ncbi:hypothetical protein GQ44DRAFT_148063 [Phaeosphaeriaceae sp. PMI808]|nr:hypothetical protein GQ44DRAFT_148063 [Phaeosphaeriaceae sp. PMI808]
MLVLMLNLTVIAHLSAYFCLIYHLNTAHPLSLYILNDRRALAAELAPYTRVIISAPDTTSSPSYRELGHYCAS